MCDITSLIHVGKPQPFHPMQPKNLQDLLTTPSCQTPPEVLCPSLDSLDPFWQHIEELHNIGGGWSMIQVNTFQFAKTKCVPKWKSDSAFRVYSSRRPFNAAPDTSAHTPLKDEVRCAKTISKCGLSDRVSMFIQSPPLVIGSPKTHVNYRCEQGHRLSRYASLFSHTHRHRSIQLHWFENNICLMARK